MGATNLDRNSLISGTRFGNYQIVRALGSGSFGAVYEAFQLPLGKRVALKVMHAHVAEQAEPVERFRREAQALVRLRHPHVVDVLDLGEVQQRPFLAMEFLEGETLTARMARSGPMSSMQAADLLIPVCVAVAAAHELSIIHRDLKPDNIFIARTMGADHLKLLDFGIAKLALPDEGFAGTATAAMLGTPFYMAPEQVQSTRSVGPQADLWSLAVIAWECLVGKKPFGGSTLFEVLQQVVALPLPPIQSLRPDLPPAFAATLQHCLSRDPSQRPPGVVYLGLALLPLASEEVRSKFAGPLQRAQTVVAPAPAAPLLAGTIAATAPSLPLGLSTERASSIEISQPTQTGRSPRRALWALAAVGGASLLVAGSLWRASDEPPGPAEVPQARAPSPQRSAAHSPLIASVAAAASARLRENGSPREASPRLLVAMDATPSSAVFLLDGVRVGTGRISLEVSSQVGHQLRVEALGHIAQTVTFRDIAPPSHIDLEPLPQAPAAASSLGGRRGRSAYTRDRVVEQAPFHPPPAAVPSPPAPPQPVGAQHRSGNLNAGEF